VESDERIRLFCALRLPDDVLDSLVAWQAAQLYGPACEASSRLVPRENLHVTLAFLGNRPAAEAAAVVSELRAAAAAAGPLRFEPRHYRETRSVGMLVLDDEGGAGALMAADLQTRLAGRGSLKSPGGSYRPESRPWLPHVTVLRFRRRPGLRPSLPNVRSIVPSDAAAYLSRLRPGGAQYEVLESVALGG
jgi:RNA 2',3'-cyclic 3'-phosphodiesterase